MTVVLDPVFWPYPLSTAFSRSVERWAAILRWRRFWALRVSHPDAAYVRDCLLKTFGQCQRALTRTEQLMQAAEKGSADAMVNCQESTRVAFGLTSQDSLRIAYPWCIQ